jgi:hypothetical protein
VQSNTKFPIERRRDSVDAGRWNQPYAPFGRREGDYARMKLRHWMELADIALADHRANGEQKSDVKKRHVQRTDVQREPESKPQRSGSRAA